MRRRVIDQIDQVADAGESLRAGFFNLFHNNNLTRFFIKSRVFAKKINFFSVPNWHGAGSKGRAKVNQPPARSITDLTGLGNPHKHWVPEG